MLQRILENRTRDDGDIVMSRRRFIRHLACGSLLTLGSPVIAEAAKARFPAHKSLALQNLNTGDKLKLTYFEKGRYIKSALQEIDYVLRDYRTGDVHRIDPALLDQLHELKLMLGVNRPFEIICGYRSPLTNAHLHHHGSGVANNSLHMQGRAIDIRLEGHDTKHVKNAALVMRRGGVGYYPKSDFVHLDTGKFRTW
ncbi:YcbK family protein [Methylomonas sp. LL1]|uniref:YcbK family protein n=1 Tax=Methylomonas sp. LL1 TaxID=2785785 RepID=UPI0018C43F39|nr:YcbK family protein [Methylomonas sp. LL1]QPK63893.1 YcbK family protein [Methylomonas sp. LL1]